jgi:CBS domain-containing protein
MAAIQPWAGSYLTPSLETATVSDAMRVGVMSCEPDAPAPAVTRMMGTHHIHAVIVEGIHRDPVHGEQLILGVISDTDLLHAARNGIEGVTAGEIAATEPVTR